MKGWLCDNADKKIGTHELAGYKLQSGELRVGQNFLFQERLTSSSGL